MRDAIVAAKRPVFFALCEWNGHVGDVFDWVNKTGNSWRTNGEPTHHPTTRSFTQRVHCRSSPYAHSLHAHVGTNTNTLTLTHSHSFTFTHSRAHVRAAGDIDAHWESVLYEADNADVDGNGLPLWTITGPHSGW